MTSSDLAPMRFPARVCVVKIDPPRPARGEIVRLIGWFHGETVEPKAPMGFQRVMYFVPDEWIGSMDGLRVGQVVEFTFRLSHTQRGSFHNTTVFVDSPILVVYDPPIPVESRPEYVGAE